MTHAVLYGDTSFLTPLPAGYVQPYPEAMPVPEQPADAAPLGMPPVAANDVPIVAAGAIPPGWNRAPTVLEKSWAQGQAGPVVSGIVTGFVADATGVVTIGGALVGALQIGDDLLFSNVTGGDATSVAFLDSVAFTVSAVAGTSATLTALDLTGLNVTNLQATGTIV